MKIHRLPVREWITAVAVGLGVGAIIMYIMIPLKLGGIIPIPKPLALAFAQLILPGKVPLPIGLLFHLAWDAFFTVVFVVLFRDRLSFGRAVGLAFVLWLIALMIFAPAVGWGFFGLAVSPKIILGMLLTHGLYAIFIWIFTRAAFPPRP